MSCIVAIGEGLIEFTQCSDAAAPLFAQGVGGDTSNVCMAATRHGARASYLSRVGDDLLGTWLRDAWRREGVDDSAVETDPDAGTGAYVVTYDERGHQFSYLRRDSAASRLNEATIEGWRPLIERSAMLHVSGISMGISVSAEAAVMRAVRIARAAGVTVQFDFNIRARLWERSRALHAIETVLPMVNIALPGREDMALLGDLRDPVEVLDWCHTRGAKSVIFKDGGNGTFVSTATDAFHLPAMPVQCVDATGAGDCFAGCLAASRLAGRSWFEAVRYASCAAALSTTRRGAAASIPSAEDVCRALGHWAIRREELPPGAKGILTGNVA